MVSKTEMKAAQAAYRKAELQEERRLDGLAASRGIINSGLIGLVLLALIVGIWAVT